MRFHSPTIEIERDTPTISAERDRLRRQLMATIAEFKSKPTGVINPRLIRQLEDSLSRLGGPIE